MLNRFIPACVRAPFLARRQSCVEPCSGYCLDDGHAGRLFKAQRTRSRCTAPAWRYAASPDGEHRRASVSVPLRHRSDHECDRSADRRAASWTHERGTDAPVGTLSGAFAPQHQSAGGGAAAIQYYRASSVRYGRWTISSSGLIPLSMPRNWRVFADRRYTFDGVLGMRSIAALNWIWIATLAGSTAIASARKSSRPCSATWPAPPSVFNPTAYPRSHWICSRGAPHGSLSTRASSPITAVRCQSPTSPCCVI